MLIKHSAMILVYETNVHHHMRGVGRSRKNSDFSLVLHRSFLIGNEKYIIRERGKGEDI